MKTYLWLLVMLGCTLSGYAAAEEWCEDFSDPVHTDSIWWGDWQHFAVNTHGVLQSQAPNAAKSALYRDSQAAINAEWSIWVRISGTCSAYNMLRFYIALAQESTDSDGYFVQIGGAGKNITLYEQKNGQTQSVIAHPARLGVLDRGAVYTQIRLTRQTDGRFRLYSQIEGVDSTWMEEGSHFAQHVNSQYTAVYVKNSQTRGYDFYIDDICVRGEEQTASIEIEDSHAAAQITLSTDHLSPNGDGWEDEVCAEYQVPNQEYQLTAAIYTAHGVLVKQWQQQEAEENASICWDGSTEQGHTADIGVYIMQIELKNTKTQDVQRRRFAISLTR